MIITLLLGLTLTATAVALVARGFIVSRLRATETLESIGRYGFAGPIELSPSPGLRGFLDDVAGSVGSLLLNRLQFGSEDELRRVLSTLLDRIELDPQTRKLTLRYRLQIKRTGVDVATPRGFEPRLPP